MTTAMGDNPATRVQGDPRPATAGWDDEEEHTTETRRSLVTSEFWIFVILSVALLFFAYESGTDSFSRDDAWRYVTWLGIGYLITRGLAKSGSYETFTRGRRD
jgi:hypothetical protein